MHCNKLIIHSFINCSNIHSFGQVIIRRIYIGNPKDWCNDVFNKNSSLISWCIKFSWTNDGHTNHGSYIGLIYTPRRHMWSLTLTQIKKRWIHNRESAAPTPHVYSGPGWPNLCLSSHDATWKESSTVTSKSGLQLWPYLCYILFWTKFGAFNLDPYMFCYHGQGELGDGGPSYSFKFCFLCFPVF